MYTILDEQSNGSLAKSEFFNIFEIKGNLEPYTLRHALGSNRLQWVSEKGLGGVDKAHKGITERQNAEILMRATLAASIDSSGYADMEPTRSFNEIRLYLFLLKAQQIYYPLLAVVAVPVNTVTIVILSRGKCGLSRCVTRYLVAMAAADLLVIILDLILRQIPIAFVVHFLPMLDLPICNIHAALLHTATDCSIWFTVTFTFDRFVTINCQKLKGKYCTERTAAVVLGTVTVLSCLKNSSWYFTLTDQYAYVNFPWFCGIYLQFMESPIWASVELLHYFLSPGLPFALILLLNVFTVRHIVAAIRGRRRLRAHSGGRSPIDPEVVSRRKSIILLFAISWNFILLWTVFLVYTIWFRLWWLGFQSVILPLFVQEIGFMLQLLSCCTNTAIYTATQTKFREQLKILLKYPFVLIAEFNKK
ncbi:putative G-protein coupled receptor 139 [Rhinoraja longicauda]